MGSAELFIRVLYWHLIPSVSSVVLTFGFMSLVVRAFNVRSPRWLYWLYFACLAKGFIVLVHGVLPPPEIRSLPLVFGMRLWDPLNIISLPSALQALPRAPTVLDQVTIGIICLLVLVLFWRWLSLIAFYRSVGGEEIHAGDAPRVFRMLDSLTHTMHTRHPRVKVSGKPYILPCIVGLFHPTIILSPELAEESPEDVLEAVLAHELGHQKRRDNLLHWVSVLLRDLLLFNPFAHLVFSKIMTVEEQDCDRIAVNATGKPKAIAEAIVYAVTLANEGGIKPLPGNLSGVRKLASGEKSVNQRVSILMAHSSAWQQKIHWVKGLVVVILALLAFLVNLYVTRPYPLLFPIFQF